MDDIRKPHSRDLRRGRVSLPGHAYLLTTTTAGRHPFFEDWRAGRIVVEVMREQQDAGELLSHAFVIMPDHLHWLMSLTFDRDLADVMRTLKTRSAKRLNGCAGAGGRRVWQPGFHDRAIRRDEDIKAVARYVIANPVRAGLVKRVGAYPLWDAEWV